GCLPRHEHHSDADVRRCVAHGATGIAQLFEQGSVFLPSAAPEPNDMHPFSSQSPGQGGKAQLVGRTAGRVRARRRVGAMQLKPFLRLFETLVKELVVELTATKRFNEVEPDRLRE